LFLIKILTNLPQKISIKKLTPSKKKQTKNYQKQYKVSFFYYQKKKTRNFLRDCDFHSADRAAAPAEPSTMS